MAAKEIAVKKYVVKLDAEERDRLTYKSISKTTFFWTILDRPAIKGHEAGRAQL